MDILPLRLSASHKNYLGPALDHHGGEALLPTLFAVEEVLLPAQMERRVVHAHPKPAFRLLEATPNYIVIA
jgi:hypothetical protein